MECLTCKTKMECYDDINYYSMRIDWLKCPKCDSKAEIHYDRNSEYIEKVTWKRYKGEI